MRSKHKTLKKWMSGLVVVCLAGFLGACQGISVGQFQTMKAHGEEETQAADKEKEIIEEKPVKEEKAKPEDASAERERVKRQPKPVRAEHVAHWEHNEHNGKQQKKKSQLLMPVR